MVEGFKPWAIVVGAGPSGLLLALMLSKVNIPVLVLEGSDVLDDSPRAAFYGPPAAYELGRAGVLDEVREQGYDPIITCWRKLDGTYLAGWDCSVVKNDWDRLACMPLKDLDQLLYRKVKEQSNVEVLFSHRVVDVGQDDSSAWVDVGAGSEKKRYQAEYVVVVMEPAVPCGKSCLAKATKAILAGLGTSRLLQRMFTTTLSNMVMKTSNSSSIESIGTW